MEMRTAVFPGSFDPFTMGHLDVVPAGDGWTCDPYGGQIRDGKIWGRGTTDDKGPTIAALFALAALRDSGLPLRRRVRILFGCNEETGSADVKYYLNQEILKLVLLKLMIV